MSGRMHSKQPRGWDRGSPGRRRTGLEREQFNRRDAVSPDRIKRSRWESPSRNQLDSPTRMRRRDFESPSKAGRNDVLSPTKSRRGGFDEGPKPSFNERPRAEEEYHLRVMHPDVHREARGPVGMVFLCSSATMRECFHFRVFGLPAAQREVVERVVPGTKLFLFNVDTKELFGVFEAASHGGLNLVPEAFVESKATYAAQVRFSIFRECLPLADDIVKNVLSENFSQRGKFDCELSADQVLKILQLFSRQEVRPGGLGQERERIVGPEFLLGVDELDQDRRRFSGAMTGVEPQLLMNRPLVDGGPLPDQAVVLIPGMVEEADQLALRYLKNHPAIAGIRLDPINFSLLSSSHRSNAQPSFSTPPMDHDHGGFGAQLNGLHPGGPFPAGQNPRLLGHPGSSLPDLANMDRKEHPGGDGGKIFGQFMPGPSGGERGLLVAPPMPHHMAGTVHQPGFPPGLPNQPGMIRPFLPGVSGPFPMAAGLMGGGPPEFGGPHVPFHRLQGPPGISAHLGNPSQLGNLQAGNHPNIRPTPNSKMVHKPKKNKQKKKSKQQKGAGSGKDDKKADAVVASVESVEVVEA